MMFLLNGIGLLGEMISPNIVTLRPHLAMTLNNKLIVIHLCKPRKKKNKKCAFAEVKDANDEKGLTKRVGGIPLREFSK